MTCSIDIVDMLYFDRNLDYDEILETLKDGILEISDKIDNENIENVITELQQLIE